MRWRGGQHVGEAGMPVSCTPGRAIVGARRQFTAARGRLEAKSARIVKLTTFDEKAVTSRIGSYARSNGFSGIVTVFIGSEEIGDGGPRCKP